MAMIQGIDGSALLQAFRQGREDRFNDAMQPLKMQQAQAAAAKQRNVLGLMGQLYGGSDTGGVSGNFAPPNPQAQLPVAAQPFDQAFNAPAMGALASGGAMPPATQAPTAAPPVSASPGAPANLLPASASPPASTGGHQLNRDVLNQLVAIDPEMGGKIMSALKDQSEMDIKQHQAKNDIMGAAAHYVQQGTTLEERQARFQHAVPQLLAAGWTQQEIAGAANDLSDRALGGYQAVASDYDKLMDRELKQREFMQGKTVPVTAGGNVAIIMPDGSARWAIGGGGGAAPPAQVHSKAEYEALPPGTPFIAPDGTHRQKPGGPTQPASGSF